MCLEEFDKAFNLLGRYLFALIAVVAVIIEVQTIVCTQISSRSLREPSYPFIREVVSTECFSQTISEIVFCSFFAEWKSSIEVFHEAPGVFDAFARQFGVAFRRSVHCDT